jgi:hypothetical protein
MDGMTVSVHVGQRTYRPAGIIVTITIHAHETGLRHETSKWINLHAFKSDYSQIMAFIVQDSEKAFLNALFPNVENNDDITTNTTST